MNKTQHTLYIGFFFAVGISVTLLLAFYGYEYYTTPLEERFFNELHNDLKPSGLIGHGVGIIGSLMMMFGVGLYMARKRIKRFARIGILKHWLEFHIFLCSLGPVLVLYHTSFKFGGIVSVSFWSMVAVVVSGVMGRFIYIQIPRTIQGQTLGFDELTEMNINMNKRLRENYKVDELFISKLEELSLEEKEQKTSTGASFFTAIKGYLKSRVKLNALKGSLSKYNISKEDRKEILSISKSKLLLNRRIGLLKSMQQLFKYWHVAHLPFALIMLIIMLIHVGVTIAFGYKWIF